MELRQLRYFVAVAEKLSFTNAARELYVTVAPLSRQVRQLEEELGVDLFVRDRRHVLLTDIGRIFCGEAKAMVDHADHVLQSMSLAKRGQIGLVRIAMTSGVRERLNRVLIEYSKRFPAVEFQ